jgi:hypothetical protein
MLPVSLNCPFFIALSVFSRIDCKSRELDSNKASVFDQTYKYEEHEANQITGSNPVVREWQEVFVSDQIYKHEEHETNQITESNPGVREW